MLAVRRGCTDPLHTHTQSPSASGVDICKDSWLEWASLIAQLVKNPPAIQETPVRFMGWDDLLEKGQATHSSILVLPLWLSWLEWESLVYAFDMHLLSTYCMPGTVDTLVTKTKSLALGSLPPMKGKQIGNNKINKPEKFQMAEALWRKASRDVARMTRIWAP